LTRCCEHHESMKSRWLLVAVAKALVSSPRRAQRLVLRLAAPLVDVQPSEESVGFELCDVVVREYKKAVKAEGRFSFAISGGSMLKMLSNLEGETAVDWSKCVMGFVSHRCVALDDDGATIKKARPAFLDSWVARGLDVIAPTGTTNAEAEADIYEAALRDKLDVVDGYPVFDLCLIGIGLDAHVGCIYPNIPDVESARVVVPITGVDGMGKLSTKLSLSIATMLAAKRSVVACAGTSAKAPLGKAQAMVRALEAAETPMSFPASALRDKATWLLDEGSAALLGIT